MRKLIGVFFKKKINITMQTCSFLFYLNGSTEVVVLSWGIKSAKSAPQAMPHGKNHASLVLSFKYKALRCFSEASPQQTLLNHCSA